MKKIYWIVIILLSGFTATAAFIPANEQSGEMSSNNSSKENLGLKSASISVADYENLTGKKLNLFQRRAFKAAQRKAMKHGIFEKEELTEGFHSGAFLLGFFTLGIGYLVCLVVAKDSNFTKWCGIGASAVLLVGTIVFHP